MTAAALVAGCQGCTGREDLDGTRRPIPGLSDQGQAYELDMGGARTVFDLYDNRATAVVHDAGGLVIECGTADMAKYVEGAYRSPWHLNATDQGRRIALVNQLAGELYLPVDGAGQGVARDADGSVQITLRARAAQARQLVSVFLNEKRLGDIPMPTAEWQTYRIRAPGTVLGPGENKLRFYFRHTGEIDGKRTAAALERIRVGTSGEVDTRALTAESVTRGDKRLHALRVQRASRLSYYVRVPTGEPALVFAYARPPDSPATTLSVHVTGAGQAPAGRAAGPSAGSDPGSGGAPLWQAAATERWAQARVDLAAHAGEVVRIDLVSTGPADWGRPQLVVAEPPSSPALVPAAPVDHVIVWVISALRGDRLASPRVPTPTSTPAPTPAFNRLAQRGVRFARAFAAAPVPGAAHVAMLTGTHPQQDEVPAQAKTLGERFSEAGFMTALISGNGFINDEAGFARGFTTYQNPMRLRHPFQARILWQRARRLVQRHKDERTFLYIVTVEPHLPYSPSLESLSAEWTGGPMRFEPADTIGISEAVAAGTMTLTREEQSYVEALYDAEVRDADAAFGEMLADLDELGIAERTAVILVADHGEELWERGNFGHGRHLHQEMLHVPLIIARPQAGGGVVIDWDVSMVDLYATVLGLAGIAPGSGIQGGDMLAAASQAPALPPPIFSHLPGQQRSLKLGRYKLVMPLRGNAQLYDLDTDPGEQRNLIGTMPLVERYLRNVFGVGVAYQPVWSRERWGDPGNVGPAFAADHGM